MEPEGWSELPPDTRAKTDHNPKQATLFDLNGGKGGKRID